MIKFISYLLFVFSFHAYAINVSNIEFHATQNCPAYLSKNQLSNPNNISIQPNKTYLVREINKPSPDWFRIEITEQHTLRWVSAECGFTQQKRQTINSCDSSGMADSYVLALSSQPGFCETYGYEAGKPECRKLAQDSYQATHLTLHGLWPNIDTCGQHYGFCGVKPQANHCNYEPIALSPIVSNDLKKIMPSFNYGSCLERHEWNKHGSCQALTPDGYFSLAMRLVTEVDQSAFGRYLTEHQGQTVTHSVLRQMISQTFGTSNSEKIFLGCKNNILVDIYVQLPAIIPENAPLSMLIDQAPNNHSRDLCGKKVKISHFFKGIWF